MNPDPQSTTPDSSPSPVSTKPAEGEKEPKADSNSRRKGHVARLPKAVRDQINHMIEDGVPYAVIIKSIGEHAKDLSVSNLSRWKQGGYADWVLQQNWLANTRTKQESASDVAADFDATPVNHAAFQLASLHIFDALRELRPGTLDEKLGGDAAAFARLIHALARASRETLRLQKYRESCAKARAALESLRDPKRKLTEEERRSLVLLVDDILGLPRQNELVKANNQTPLTTDNRILNTEY